MFVGLFDKVVIDIVFGDGCFVIWCCDDDFVFVDFVWVIVVMKLMVFCD